MEKVKIFFKTSLLGGLAVILPIGILFAIFFWIFDLVARIIEPLTKIVIVQAGIREYIAGFIILTIIISACFLVGVTVKTRLGSFLHEFVEKRFLKKVPFYSIVKETIVQVIGSGKPVFITDSEERREKRAKRSFVGARARRDKGFNTPPLWGGRE